MKIVHTLEPTIWKNFVNAHPHGQIFHTPEMTQVFTQSRGYAPSLWAAVDNDGQPQAMLLPVQITLMDAPLARLFTTRAVAYASVLAAPGEIGSQALAQLLPAYNQAHRNKLLFTELRNLTDLTDVQPILNRAGFVYEDHMNFLIDLTPGPDALWNGINSNARRNVRKARKTGVVITEITDPANIPGVYTLLAEVYHRLQVPLADQSFFQSSFDVLQPCGMMKILTAQVNGVTIGALTLLLHNHTIIYWYTGILRQYSSHRPADLLVWHTLEWGSAKGYRVFDFGGAGKPDEEYGVRDFKAKFGGELVNFGRNVSVHMPRALKLSALVYKLTRWLR